MTRSFFGGDEFLRSSSVIRQSSCRDECDLQMCESPVKVSMRRNDGCFGARQTTRGEIAQGERMRAEVASGRPVCCGIDQELLSHWARPPRVTFIAPDDLALELENAGKRNRS